MTFQNLNRKIHIHLGLGLLFFVWLFSVSGLILNHGTWKMTSFWEEREERNFDFKVSVAGLENQAVVDAAVQHLSISGEVRIQNQTLDRLEFRIESPGVVNDIGIDLATGLSDLRGLL